MTQIKNKPYYLRLTVFSTSEETPSQVGEQVNAFRNYVSQLDASNEMSILIKKSAQNPDGGIVALPTYTNYSDLVSEIDESEVNQHDLDSESDDASQSPRKLDVIKEGADEEEEKKVDGEATAEQGKKSLEDQIAELPPD